MNAYCVYVIRQSYSVNVTLVDIKTNVSENKA